MKTRNEKSARQEENCLAEVKGGEQVSKFLYFSKKEGFPSIYTL